MVNISKAAMYSSNYNTSTFIPCYGAALTCGMNACDLGPYNMSPWKADYFKGNNASISACNVAYAVTIQAIVDDGVNRVVWNGNQINVSTFLMILSWVLIPNVFWLRRIIYLKCKHSVKTGKCEVRVRP